MPDVRTNIQVDPQFQQGFRGYGVDLQDSAGRMTHDFIASIFTELPDIQELQRCTVHARMYTAGSEYVQFRDVHIEREEDSFTTACCSANIWHHNRVDDWRTELSRHVAALRAQSLGSQFQRQLQESMISYPNMARARGQEVAQIPRRRGYRIATPPRHYTSADYISNLAAQIERQSIPLEWHTTRLDTEA